MRMSTKFKHILELKQTKKTLLVENIINIYKEQLLLYLQKHKYMNNCAAVVGKRVHVLAPQPM